MLTICMGSDHRGFHIKSRLIQSLTASGFEVLDIGTDSEHSVDYPDFAHAVARLVGTGDCGWGIVIDGAGIGSCMVANKVPGVLAAMAYDVSSANNSVEHNNANVLCFAGAITDAETATRIVETWLNTQFEGGRHQRRVDQITALEADF